MPRFRGVLEFVRDIGRLTSGGDVKVRTPAEGSGPTSVTTSSRCTLLLLFGILLLASQVSAHPGSGIAVDATGQIYFASGPRILKIATNNTAEVIVHDRTNERFYQLHHLQRTPDGGLVTASDLGNVVWRFTPEGTLTSYYPPPNEDRSLRVGMGGDPFAVDARGNIYAVNSVQDRFTQIHRIAPDGRIELLAGGDWGFADGRGAAARFGDLHSGSMLVSPEGTLLLTDDRIRVRRIDADGTVTTLAGGAEPGDADGPGAKARFDGAAGLALDRDGSILVVEQAGRIRRISPQGTVTTLTGRGRTGGRDGSLTEASFDHPTGIAVGPNGDLLILEPEHERVRRISGGRVTTVYRPETK